MFAVALVTVQLVSHATNLPPGAILRLGDDRFRAGAPVRHLRFSDDGARCPNSLRSDKGSSSAPSSCDARLALPAGRSRPANPRQQQQQ